jgi:biotin transport system substrate-specific component
MQIVHIVLGSIGVALCAQISIRLPFTPVPLTGQTFAVLLAGIVLGSRKGAAAVALYLAEGVAGLPVYASGASGAGTFLGPTGGYLLAFPLAAALTGALAERGWDRTPLRAGAAMLLGSAVILGMGGLWLIAFVGGADAALWQGILPFLPGDLVKTALAALALPGTWRLLGRRR